MTFLNPSPRIATPPETAKVAELVDALVSGASGSQPWGFESPLSHQSLMRSIAREFAVCSTLVAAAAIGSESGKLVAEVHCLSDSSETYALFLPAQYTPERQWPALLIFDPRGRGESAAQLFQPAASEMGWILLSSNNTQSDTTWEVNEKALRAIVPELKRYSIDPKRIYAAGFSGGATIAWSLGQRSQIVHGVIGCGQPWLDDLHAARSSFEYFGAVGRIDFNNSDVRRIDRDISQSGRPHHVAFFDGGHRWMPQDVARQAVAWFELQAMREGLRSVDAAFAEKEFSGAVTHAEAKSSSGDRLSALDEYRSIVQDFSGLHETALAARRASELESDPLTKKQMKAQKDADAYEARALAGLISTLRQIMASDEPFMLARFERESGLAAIRQRASNDSPEGLAAARVLERLFVETSFYLPQDYRRKRDYSRAAVVLSIAETLKPERHDVSYELARVLAARGDVGAALNALSRAVTRHCESRTSLQQDPDLAPLRENPRFKDILEQCRETTLRQ